MNGNRIKVLLVDDHAMVREGLRHCLAEYPQLEVVGEAGNGEQALDKARALSPDIVVMDISMPGMNGLTTTERLQSLEPRPKVLLLSMYENPEYVREGVRLGARGYVVKTATPRIITEAIETIHRGGTYFSPEVAQVVMNDYVHHAGQPGKRTSKELSPRERQVIILIANGASNKEIAQRLGVGVRTIETHRERIMRKLDLHTVADLTKYTLSHGMITL